LAVYSESLFDSRSSAQLMEETLKSLSDLKNHNKKRLGQFLVLYHKRLEASLEPDDIIWYLEKTQNCLNQPELCASQNSSQETKQDHLSNFYTLLTDDDLTQIKNSLNQIENLSWSRAKTLNLIFNSLKLGIQESDGPNDDSLTGGNFIEQIFQGAGVFSPKTELPPNRVDWAWCAAYITSIIHQAGLGFSFISLQEQINACKEADKLEHCHPVQVEFLLNWAYRKTKVQAFSSEAKMQAGDILILLSPKTKRASHIGFYLAKSPECDKNFNNNCWIYSLEGNAGPFINDKLEDKWPEVLELVEKKNITPEEYERLLDRLTIVKRPAQNWDYTFSLY